MLLENCVTASLLKNLFSGLGIYSSPLISASEVWGGQEIDGQHDTHSWFQLSFQFPTRPPCSEQCLQSLQYFVTEEDE